MSATLPAGCNARRCEDTMICGSCGLQWAIDDADPPKCGRKRRADIKFEKLADPGDGVPTTENGEAIALFPTVTAQIPTDLSSVVALEMAGIFERLATNRADDRVRAMQAAYRVFLSSLP